MIYMRSLLVFAGGTIGALARWGVNELIPNEWAGFPWATFLVNVTGAFVLGAGAVVLIERTAHAGHLRPFLLVGALGAYTTFSTMAMDGVLLVEAGRAGLALTYWMATAVAGLMAGVVGIGLARTR